MNQIIKANYIGNTTVVAKVCTQQPIVSGSIVTGGRGPGVQPGGTTDQVLVKASDADFDTKWDSKVVQDVGWGEIQGELIDQLDLQAELDSKANNSDLVSEVSRAEAVEAELQGDIESLNTNVDTKIDKAVAGELGTVMQNVSVNQDGPSSVVLTTSSIGVDTPGDPISTDLSLPIVNETAAGISPSADHIQIATNTAAIAALQSETPLNYLVTFPSDTPTQAEIQALYESASGNTGEALESTTLFDTSRQMYAKWYTAYDAWQTFAAGTGGGAPTPIATNTSFGIVKGSVADGQVYMENDGTMSLNGYDALQTAVSNNTTAIISKAEKSYVDQTIADYKPKWG